MQKVLRRVSAVVLMSCLVLSLAGVPVYAGPAHDAEVIADYYYKQLHNKEVTLVHNAELQATIDKSNVDAILDALGKQLAYDQKQARNKMVTLVHNAELQASYDQKQVDISLDMVGKELTYQANKAYNLSVAEAHAAELKAEIDKKLAVERARAAEILAGLR